MGKARRGKKGRGVVSDKLGSESMGDHLVEGFGKDRKHYRQQRTRVSQAHKGCALVNVRLIGDAGEVG